MTKDYKDEIEEILNKAGELNIQQKHPQHSNSFYHKFKNLLFSKEWKIAPGYIISLGIVFIVSYVVLRNIDSNLISAVGWLGLVLVVFGYSIIFIQPTKTKKTWRGREIDFEKDAWVVNFLKRFKK